MSESDYYDATQGAPAWPTLLTALEAWKGAPGLAVDLGCGAGRDTLELLRRGWRVQAVDAAPRALERLEDRAPKHQRDRLRTVCERFESLELPPTDLVNAAFSLPFCSPAAFPGFWSRICRSLAGGGLFAGHFFGNRDDWASSGLTIHRHRDLREMFEGWDLLDFDEREFDGKTAVGKRKHWHLFQVVARLRG